MLALVASPQREEKIELREVAEPEPGPDEAIVEVRAISLNRGEVNRLSTAEDGWRPGWDVAGVVKQRARNGSGPAEGARVVGFVLNGAWAQRVTVPTSRLAELPDAVSFAAAATLPVAGLTALRTLRLGGLLLGKKVLVTGAAGGVGRLAVQLAAQAGAHVTGIVGSQERGQGLRDLRAADLVTKTDDANGLFDLILESAGGDSLAAAFRKVAPGGTIVSFGNSSRQETTFNISDFYTRASARLLTFFLLADPGPFSQDLSYLASLIASGRLDPQISYQGSWHQAGEALTALRERRIQGKAVLLID
jgi:NADPH:quinone reductase-like Zn-dependent oxidoreductase